MPLIVKSRRKKRETVVKEHGDVEIIDVTSLDKRFTRLAIGLITEGSQANRRGVDLESAENEHLFVSQSWATNCGNACRTISVERGF